MIPEEHRDSIISAGLGFIRTITDAYGADEGMRMWETIANTIDPDIKGQIFFAMISGTHNDTIVLKSIGHNGITNKVAAIKEIRAWTGYGLKEAKDTADWVEMGKNVKIKVKPQEHSRALAGLRSVGYMV